MYYIGYIAIAGVNSQDGKSVFLLKIPNREIEGWYIDIINQADIGGEKAESAVSEEPIAMGNTHRENKNDDDNDKFSCILE